jgi:hypothetical protein
MEYILLISVEFRIQTIESVLKQKKPNKLKFIYITKVVFVFPPPSQLGRVQSLGTWGRYMVIRIPSHTNRLLI